MRPLSCARASGVGDAVAVDVRALPVARTSLYLEHRDRQSYEFALVSAAVPRGDDAFKVELARRAIVRGLGRATGTARP